MTPTIEPGPDPFDPLLLIANDGREYRLPACPVWHKGPPPSEGWWPASSSAELCIWDLRFWNGEFWSLAAAPWDTSDDADEAKRMRNAVPREFGIAWADRWWLS